MTAEVVVMNKIGVALAADSAVTIGGDLKKIYTSADKLFQLTDFYPIGVMVYGSADIMGYPWETIIKCFKNSSFCLKRDTVSEYANDFFDFIISSESMISEKDQTDFLTDSSRVCFGYIFSIIHNELQSFIDINGEINEKQIKKIFSTTVENELSEIRESDYLDGFDDNFLNSLKRKFKKEIKESIDFIFKKIPRYSKTNNDLVSIFFESLLRGKRSIQNSGLVFAGFGECQVFPELIEYRICGIMCDKIIGNKKSYKIGKNSRGLVVPFAQREMVATFMEGVNPELRSAMQDLTLACLRNVSDEIVNDLNGDATLYNNLIVQMSEQVNEEWRKLTRKLFIDPVVDMVASLPKDELGAMAEAVVELTKFKRKISRQAETVGGPIDVAIITKGDGFVWVKRKHYFPIDLNPKFQARYNIFAASALQRGDL